MSLCFFAGSGEAEGRSRVTPWKGLCGEEERVTQWLLVWTGHQVGALAGPWNAHLFNLEKGGGGGGWTT